MQSLNYSKEQACIDLQVLIKNWMSEKDGRNVLSLAKGSGVSENCIRRILNQNSMPKTENLQKIINFIKKDNNRNILSSLPENLNQHIKFEMSYLNFEEIQSRFPIAEKSSLMPSNFEKLIFFRASIADGISLDEINNSFGQKGLNAVHSLTANNLVTTQNNYVKVVPQYKQHSWNLEDYKEIVQIQIDTFLKTFTNTNYIFNVYEGVDIKGYIKIMDVIENSHKMISHIISEHPGDIPVTVSGAMDTMTTYDYFKKNKEADNE